MSKAMQGHRKSPFVHSLLVLIILALTTVIVMAQLDGAPGTVQAAVTVTKVAESTTVTPDERLAYTVVFANSSDNGIALDVITDVLPSPFVYWGMAVGSEITDEPVDQAEPEIVWQGPYIVPAVDTLTLRYWAGVPSETPVSDTPYTNTVTAVHDATSVGPAEAGVTVEAAGAGPGFTLSAAPGTLGACAPANAVYTVDLGSVQGFNDPVTLSASGNPAGTTAGFSANPVTPPGSSSLTVGSTGSASAGSTSIEVTGLAPTSTMTQAATLALYTAIPSAPALTSPADGATGVGLRPTFSWSAVAQAGSYLLEVATDPGFSNIVYSASETGTSHTATVSLSINSGYFWRVTSGNICGSSPSSSCSFTTQIATLVCSGSAVDFESGMPSDWTVVDNTGGSGSAWSLTSDVACGQANLTGGSGEAACADSSAAAFDTELVSNPFDLSAQGGVALDFKAVYNDRTSGSNDRFEVDVWDGSGWINELSWDEDHGPEEVHLNLWAYRGQATTQVRFRHFGDGFDGYAQVDDVTLGCTADGPPAISVEPASLGVEPLLGEQPTKQLHILSQGGAPLTWNFEEDDGDCDSPTNIAWLDMAPDAGSTLPLNSAVVDVQFDSRDLEPGPYSASLCVNSNDEARPLIVVPVEMTVRAAGIAVDKQAEPDRAALGDTIHYIYRVTNTGDTSLSGVVAVDDELGAVPLGSNSLEPKAWTSGVLTLTVVEDHFPGPLYNTVTVSGTPPAGAQVTAMAEAVVPLIEPGAENRVFLPLVTKGQIEGMAEE